jgi:hypothetical protein
VFYLLSGGLTPLDALMLSWAEGLIAISLNRIRLAVNEIRTQALQPAQQRSGRRRGKRTRNRILQVLAGLAKSLAGGVLLYTILGLFAVVAISIISGNKGIPWTITSESFWIAAGWMALAAAAEAIVTLIQLTRQAPTAALFDQRTIAMLLRFIIDFVLLILGASLIVAFGIPAAAVAALIGAKVCIDITAEYWGASINRRRTTAPAASEPR